jgi:hypothetical protein
LAFGVSSAVVGAAPAMRLSVLPLTFPGSDRLCLGVGLRSLPEPSGDSQWVETPLPRSLTSLCPVRCTHCDRRRGDGFTCGRSAFDEPEPEFWPVSNEPSSQEASRSRSARGSAGPGRTASLPTRVGELPCEGLASPRRRRRWGRGRRRLTPRARGRPSRRQVAEACGDHQAPGARDQEVTDGGEGPVLDVTQGASARRSPSASRSGAAPAAAPRCAPAIAHHGRSSRLTR